VTLGNLSSGTGSIAILSSGGAVTQTAGGGSVSLTTTGANAITLANTGNVLTGSLLLTTATGNATIFNNNAGGTAIGATAVGGNLSIQANSGNVTQSGGWAVNGITTVTANAVANQQITLNNVGNSFAGPVTASTTGATGHVTLTNNHASGFAVTATAGGGLTLNTLQVRWPATAVPVQVRRRAPAISTG